MQQEQVTTTKKSWIENLDFFLGVALLLFFVWFFHDFKWSFTEFPFEPLIGLIVTGGTVYINKFAKKPIEYHFIMSFQNKFAQSITLTNRSEKAQIINIKALTSSGEVGLLQNIELKPNSAQNMSAKIVGALHDEIKVPQYIEIVIETKSVNDVIGVYVEQYDKSTAERTKQEITKNSN